MNWCKFRSCFSATYIFSFAFVCSEGLAINQEVEESQVDCGFEEVEESQVDCSIDMEETINVRFQRLTVNNLQDSKGSIADNLETQVCYKLGFSDCCRCRMTRRLSGSCGRRP